MEKTLNSTVFSLDPKNGIAREQLRCKPNSDPHFKLIKEMTSN